MGSVRRGVCRKQRDRGSSLQPRTSGLEEGQKMGLGGETQGYSGAPPPGTRGRCEAERGGGRKGACDWSPGHNAPLSP